MWFRDVPCSAVLLLKRGSHKCFRHFTLWVSISTQPHGEHFQVFLGINGSREVLQKWHNHPHTSEEKTFLQQPGVGQHSTQTFCCRCALQVHSWINVCIISQRNSDHGPNCCNNSELLCREKSKAAAQYLRSWRKQKMEMCKDKTKRFVGSKRKRRPNTSVRMEKRKRKVRLQEQRLN